jgi:hypothetical protein
MPTESAGFADAITAPNGTPAAPTAWPRRRASRRRVANARTRKGKVEPTSGLEPLTCGEDRTYKLGSGTTSEPGRYVEFLGDPVTGNFLFATANR